MIRAALVLVCALAAAPAAADAVTPWAQAVPEERQARANALFAEGNTLFGQQAHAPALAKYRAALALWDHPLIRFNTAVTLIRLDRPLEAAEHLELSLAYGAQPFESDALYRSARDYQTLLRGRVGSVTVACTQAGTQIALDGKPWFTCPGTRTTRVEIGEHAIAGEHAELVPATRRVFVRGGATVTEQVTLVPLDRALAYPTPRWIPWSITGAGVAAAIGGVAVWVAGTSQMRDFERDFAIACARGCAADLGDQPALRELRDRAERKGTLGAALVVAGGLATAGGIVWTIVNRPRRSRPAVEVAPASGGLTAIATWSF